MICPVDASLGQHQGMRSGTKCGEKTSALRWAATLLTDVVQRSCLTRPHCDFLEESS